MTPTSLNDRLHPASYHKTLTPLPVTRTQKANNRDHVGLANGTAAPEEHLPRYFAKAGHDGVNPSSTKKQGQGRGNWYVLILCPFISSTSSSAALSSSLYFFTFFFFCLPSI